MVDGASTLMAMTWALRGAGSWSDERGSNLLDGGAPFYDTYRCADGGYLAVGAIEPQFWAIVVDVLGLDDVPDQLDVGRWPTLRSRVAAVIATRDRDEWAAMFAPLDACVSPVLTMGEAMRHPHICARNTIIEVDGVPQPAAAPRLSRTPGTVGERPCSPGQHTRQALRDWGFAPDEVATLERGGAVQQL
jgi:alpha-methylacyl-CoA racemase